MVRLAGFVLSSALTQAYGLYTRLYRRLARVGRRGVTVEDCTVDVEGAYDLFYAAGSAVAGVVRKPSKNPGAPRAQVWGVFTATIDPTVVDETDGQEEERQEGKRAVADDGQEQRGRQGRRAAAQGRALYVVLRNDRDTHVNCHVALDRKYAAVYRLGPLQSASVRIVYESKDGGAAAACLLDARFTTTHYVKDDEFDNESCRSAFKALMATLPPWCDELYEFTKVTTPLTTPATRHATAPSAAPPSTPPSPAGDSAAEVADDSATVVSPPTTHTNRAAVHMVENPVTTAFVSLQLRFVAPT
jgi:hypothetical protein